jgi:hypothetical protein
MCHFFSHLLFFFQIPKNLTPSRINGFSNLKQLCAEAFSLIFADHTQGCTLQRFPNVNIFAIEIYTGLEVTE